MSTYLPKDDPKLLLSQYKNQSDTVSDALADFEYWVEKEMPNVDAEQFDFVQCAIKMYLLEDDKSQTIIKREELRRLDKWKKNI